MVSEVTCEIGKACYLTPIIETRDITERATQGSEVGHRSTVPEEWVNCRDTRSRVWDGICERESSNQPTLIDEEGE